VVLRQDSTPLKETPMFAPEIPQKESAAADTSGSAPMHDFCNWQTNALVGQGEQEPVDEVADQYGRDVAVLGAA
jgi:hypothetical protein